jgi:hypothetical protein
MKYSDLINKLKSNVIVKGKNFDTIDLHNIVVSDMLSEVLTIDKDHIFLITSLSSHQTLRTLDHVAGSGCIITNGSPIQAGMKELAQELGITILQTELPSFEVCVVIGKLLGL